MDIGGEIAAEGDGNIQEICYGALCHAYAKLNNLDDSDAILDAQPDAIITPLERPKDDIPSYSMGGILADVMGLGKTLSMISAIVSSLPQAAEYVTAEYQNFASPASGCRSRATLVIVPSMQVLDVWKSEMSIHVKPGNLKICTFHGSSRPKSPEGVVDHDLVLTTYGTLSADSNDLRVLQKIEWYRVVLDEDPHNEEISIGLEGEERLVYDRILKKCARDIDEAVSTKAKIKTYSILFAAIVKLRKLCNHGTLSCSAQISLSDTFPPGADGERDCDFCGGNEEDTPALVRTGSVGLNLTAANYVHLVEPQWNPSVEEQAVARAVRMGQTRPVTVTRYIVKRTVEENILSLQKKKSSLAKFTLDSGPEDEVSGKLEDLRFILGGLDLS
ncbi:hypothetical protein CEP51_010756 [Fusarium floridanum]|uniref:Helicase C-terminal domain-containing protein n=1 Tax=Fusarium floridanum TaxID=1325733 RepID=A0A428RDF2_9HYPO|nr:hypothetical protein CEP51_010756 [Fusarium floridanum]